MADVQKIAEEIGGLTLLEARDLVKTLEEKLGVKADGYIPLDEQIAEFDLKNKSLLDLPDSSIAVRAVDGLKFSLAHVSWPWCDEHIAVFGKLRQAYKQRSDLALEMFVDLTPGTPVIYRQEVLTKLFTVGYQVEDNIFFGTDNSTGDYNATWAREWIARDNEIYRQLGLSDEVIEKVYSGNLSRFLSRS